MKIFRGQEILSLFKGISSDGVLAPFPLGLTILFEFLTGHHHVRVNSSDIATALGLLFVELTLTRFTQLAWAIR